MKALLRRNLHFTFLLLAFFIAELIVFPAGEFPLNDDWAYAKSIQLLHREGVLNIGDWPAMTLLTHLLWGYGFTGLFGFSFFVLRLSTIVSSLIGVCFFFRVLEMVSRSRPVALAGSFALLFNPLYFNLSNTFMTDVNFNTLLVMGLYFAFSYYQTLRWSCLPVIAVLSVMLVLLRQFGVVYPLCFLLSTLALRERRAWSVTAGILIMGLTLASLMYYQNYLKSILSENAAYRFVEQHGTSDSVFWEKTLANLKSRYASIVYQVLFYSFPAAVLFIRGLFVRTGFVKAGMVWLLCLGLSIALFNGTLTQMGNVFEDMSVGAETSYEILNMTYTDHKHTYSPFFNGFLMEVCKYFFSSVTLCVLVLIVWQSRTGSFMKAVFTPVRLLLLSSFTAYVGLLVVSDSYFDRYHIPLVTLAIIAVSRAAVHLPPRWRAASVVLLFFFYISVFGTRDYFLVNRQRWTAYAYLHDELRVPTSRINAGFEINCWNEGKWTWWQNFLTLEGYDYLIQYQPEPGFRLLKEYEFRRTFPWKKDKINIFVRERKDESHDQQSGR
jgi:hypothetical protein